MSNIGKIKVILPPNLEVKVYGWKLFVKGPFGEKTLSFPIYTRLVKTESLLSFDPYILSAQSFGLLQRQLRAFIYGMAYVFVKRIIFVGVGYRARIEEQGEKEGKKKGKILVLRLGFSHEICLKIPSSLNVSIVKRNNLILKGPSLEDLCQFAYRLRSFRPPEPFKGKGILCEGEIVRRKEGKKKKL